MSAAKGRAKERTKMEQATCSAGIQTVDGFQVCVLRETQKATAVAEIAPGLGNNCYAFRVGDTASGSEGDNWLNLIDAPPDLRTLQEHPDVYGIPVLFPFPNRIRGGTWRFEGETYQFDKPPESPTSTHGLLLNRSYQVESRAADENGAVLTCTLDSRDFADIGRQYPFPFKIGITHTLKDAVLSMCIAIQNTGGRNMPMGFGIHPYFRVGLSSDANVGAALIKVPAATYWELDVDSVPTGNRYAATGGLDLRAGKPFAGLALDHVFTDVQREADGVSRCVIENRDTGHGVVMESGARFRELVVYTPPGREVICFEPYTCPTDAINLEAKGIPAGVMVLAPGETFSETVRIASIFPQATVLTCKTRQISEKALR
jgi:aldose 1-epimerase